MSASNRFRLAACCQLLPTELPNRLQHLVSRHAIAPSSLPEKTVFDQGRDAIEDIGREGEATLLAPPFITRSSHDSFGGFQREPANEDREAAEQRLLSISRGGRSSTQSCRASFVAARAGLVHRR